MKKNLLTIALSASACLTAQAGMGLSLPDSLQYSIRLGYNIGGTAPIGLPATIRSLNSYNIQPNFLLGFDVHKELTPRWGILMGLRLESKGMEIDATVKNYHIAIVQGGKSLEGYFSGNDVTQVELQMVTLPVLATYRLNQRLYFKFGPYVSYLSTRNFKGNVYGGYLRETDPTGPKILIGTDGETTATYDFSGSMRRFHYGINVGADWNIYRRWGVYGEVAWGLNGILKSDFHTIEQTLYPIYGSFGLTYKLK